LIRRFRLGVVAVTAATVLSLAPAAMASTLSESDTVVTWTAATGIANNVDINDTATTIEIVTPDDPVVYSGATPSANCVDSDGTAGDGVADEVICTGVTSVIANSEDANDTVDAADVATHTVTVNAGDGNDSVYGGDQADMLNGEAGDDTVYGGGAGDTITGGDGEDDLYGPVCCGGGSPDGDDSIAGGNGDDYGGGGTGNDLIDLGAGDDGGAGGPGDDHILLGAGDDDQDTYGGPGSDLIEGGDGEDENIYGGCDGSCGVSQNDGNDTLLGGVGDDGYFYGEAGDDTIDGGTGNDYYLQGDCGGNNTCSSGDAGNDSLTGGPGQDYLDGGPGNDNLDGGTGDDDLFGGTGGDTVHGGDGMDELYDGEGMDSLNGDAGDDSVYAGDFTAGDVFRGGDGYDTVSWNVGCDAADSIVVSLDNAANDAFTYTSGNCGGTDISDVGNDFGADFEVLNVESGNTPVNASGSIGPNAIYTDAGNDTIDAREGADSVVSGAGDDTINSVDGTPDLINCGDGVDTANVDQFDNLFNCENVTTTQVASAFAVPEDAPPAVALTNPVPGSTKSISSKTATVLAATAADDKGISKVEFYVGQRLVCTDTAAPFTCSYLPQSNELGRNVVTAVAYDTAGQTASALAQVTVPRFAPRAFSTKTSPSKDTKFPFRFTTSGKITLPANVTKALGCKGGFISVQFRAGKKTVSNRRVGLKSNCTYKSAVTFRIPSRLHPKTLQVLVRFLGNGTLTAKKATTRKVRVSA
jgi:Ca2+-binding RTX toxin-like protein